MLKAFWPCNQCNRDCIASAEQSNRKSSKIACATEKYPVYIVRPYQLAKISCSTYIFTTQFMNQWYTLFSILLFCMKSMRRILLTYFVCGAARAVWRFFLTKTSIFQEDCMGNLPKLPMQPTNDCIAWLQGKIAWQVCLVYFSLKIYPQ